MRSNYMDLSSKTRLEIDGNLALETASKRQKEVKANMQQNHRPLRFCKLNNIYLKNMQIDILLINIIDTNTVRNK